MANFFDQFDNPGPSIATVVKSQAANPFDQFDTPTQTAAGPDIPFIQTDPIKYMQAYSAGHEPDVVSGMTDRLGRAFTFGLTDVGSGLMSMLNGGSYKSGVMEDRARQNEFSSQHPVASAIGTTVGALGGVGPFKDIPSAPTLGGRIIQGAKIAGPLGAISGAATGDPDNPLRDAAKGGIFGLGTGVAFPILSDLLLPVGEWAARGLGLSSPQSQAASRIATAVQRDSSAGGPGLEDIQQSLANSNAPLSVADVGGENVQGLAGQAVRQPGPGRQSGIDFLTSRDAGAGQRLADTVDQSLAAGPDSYSTTQALMAQRAQQAAPLYQQAYAANQSIASPEINAVLDTPAGQKALSSARTMMQNDMTLLGRPDPQLTEAFNEARNLGLTDAPATGAGVASGLKLQTLDYVKRALDDQIAGETDIAGNVTNNGRILIGLKNKLLNAMDNADSSGLYAQARQAWSGPSQSLSALQAGSKIYSAKSPAQISAEINGLDEGDRPFYLLGAANAIKDRIAKTGSGGNEARAIVGNEYVQNILRPLFPSQSAFDSFINSAKNESTMFGTKTSLIGGSQTAGRVAQDTAEGGSIGDLLKAGVSAMEGAPVATSMNLLSAARNFARSPSPAVNAEVSRMLLNSDPADLQVMLDMIGSRMNRGNGALAITVPAASQLPPLANRLLQGPLSSPNGR